MLHKPTLISPSSAFWGEAARALLGHPLLDPGSTGLPRDMSGTRVVVPTFTHAQLLKAALVRQAGAAFIPPRITTLSAWCGLLAPESGLAVAASARLMELYAELRQHAWLKKLFSARRNTDLLPLAQMLLTLSDELTLSLLPTIAQAQDAAHLRWQQALAQLSPAARQIVSDETQLVWSIWKTQLDERDALALRYRQMMRLAERAHEPLAWIAPAASDSFEQAFLHAYGERQTVVPILLDWEPAAVEPAFAAAWPELRELPALPDGEAGAPPDARKIDTPQRVALCAARSMEQEAQFGAQTIIDWLQAGKTRIAVIAQDRVVARRLRALLERAQVFVADETGWKLSTTRAASAIAAWFDVVATRAETMALLDWLKSPFVFAQRDDKDAQLMAIEVCLRNANVLGGWEAIMHALAMTTVSATAARELLGAIAQQAASFSGRKTIAQWSAVTEAALQTLGMWQALLLDAAGVQVVALLQEIVGECHGQAQSFSFAEWRAFIGLQLEETAFLAPGVDRRIVMLPLNGAQLRSFDAVLMLGCDARHLPSPPNETLFFANAVRRELGLATRETRQRQQLRDFAALLSSNGCVVLSWQTHQDGEPNPLSPWILRLQLMLERSGAPSLPMHAVQIGAQHLPAMPVHKPAPAAPQLLPAKLSASGYNSLVACPYQFFATRMLGLSGFDELTDMPEKRDYGDWLHKILNSYHEAIRDRQVPEKDRASLLQEISADIFEREVASNAAALGYYMRWQKVLPAYLAWANGREAEGWYFVFGERKFEKVLRWDDGEIILHGRIDRIDETAAGERAVLDYKTRNASALREKLKQGEDQQLPIYGMLSDLPVSRAHYVPLETMKDKIDNVEASDFGEWQRILELQLRANMQAVAHGAALPASGIESVCEYCAVRGLCRKGAW